MKNIKFYKKNQYINLKSNLKMPDSFKKYIIDNKGKNITFKHDDKIVSKIIVEAHEDYFTVKSNNKDNKIDGFYYYSDCSSDKEEVNEVVKIIEKYKSVVLSTEEELFSVDTMFLFKSYDCESNMITGTNLSIGDEISYSIDSIKEISAIEKGKYKKVYTPLFSSKKRCVRSLFGEPTTTSYEGYVFGNIKTKEHEESSSHKENVNKNNKIIKYEGKTKVIEIITEEEEYYLVKDILNQGTIIKVFKKYIEYY
jgi:hypothetical protein